MSRSHIHNVPIARLGPFDLLSFVGEGSMGQVWRARHRDQNVDAAIKVITGEQALREDFQRRFRHEVRAVAGLSHPGIVTVFDYGPVTEQAEAATFGELRTGSPCLAMEFCPNGSLGELEEPLTFGQVRSILLSLLDALAYAHARGVIHRDLKPANILLGDDDLTGVKLSDFGLAFIPEGLDTPNSSRRTACGTPTYMPPEQLLGNWRDIGPWSDLYSLGCIAFQLVCGAPPYDGHSIVEIAQKHVQSPVPGLDAQLDIPAEFEGWIRRLLHKDPRRRFRNAADAAWQLSLMSTTAEATQPLEASRSASGIAPTRAPLPSSWHHMGGRRPSIQLLGAGLGLYGLRHIPLVGRDEERDVLWETLDHVVRDETPQAVMLRGAAGTGKSYLAEWLCERAQEIGAAISLKATHSPSPGGDEGLPRMLARYFRTAGLQRTEITERLRAWFEAHGRFDAYLWDALTEIIRPATDEDVAGGQRRVYFAGSIQRYGLIGEVLELLCQERAVVIWLDDLQWASDSLEFLHFVLESNAFEHLPIFFVATIRDDALADESAAKSQLARLALDARVAHCALGPLSHQTQAELIEKLLYLAPSLARKVADRTEGSPLFAVQLIGDWVTRGVLEVGDDGFVLADGEEAPFPDNIFEVWTSRLSEVLSEATEEDVRALELAAVLGIEVDEAEWQACLQLADYAYPSEAVQTLLSRRLLEPTDTGIRFVHGMLRESLERRADEAGRLVEHNRVCARMLGERYQKERRLAERLGRHLLAARAYLDALDPLLAGSRARIEAVELDTALVLLDLHLEAIDALELPAECAPRIKNTALRALVLAVRSEYDEAEVLARAAVDAARRLGDPHEIARCLFKLAQCQLYHRGDHASALDCLLEARRLSIDSDDDHLKMMVRQFLGVVLSRSGQLDEAIIHLNAARALADKLGNYKAQAVLIRELGSWERRRGRYAAAERILREALVVCEKVGLQLRIADTLVSLADVVRLRGRLDEAERLYRQAAEHGRTTRPDLVTTAHLNLALLSVQREGFDEAQRWLDTVRPIYERAQNRAMLLFVDALSLSCLADQGEWDAFGTCLDRVLRTLQKQTLVDADMAICLQAAGHLAVPHQRIAQARRALEAAAEQWEGAGNDEQAEACRRELDRLAAQCC